MKSVLMALVALAAVSAQVPAAQAASPKPIKVCSTTLSFPGQPHKSQLLIEIAQKSPALEATVTQTIEGVKTAYKDQVTLSTHSIRDGLSAQSNPDDLNQGEALIAHAMVFTADPELGKDIALGFDLALVRSAKVYQVGKASNMGSSSVVEALDKDGQLLGTFLGGFLVSPCL